MQSYEHVSSRPTTSPSTGFLARAPSAVYRSLSGVPLGHGQGIGDLHGHCRGGPPWEVSDSSWETGLHAPRTSKHGPGSSVYTPWEQVRSALWGTPRPAKSQNLHLDDFWGFRAHPGTLHRGSQAEAWSPPDHLPFSSLQPHTVPPPPMAVLEGSRVSSPHSWDNCSCVKAQLCGGVNDALQKRHPHPNSPYLPGGLFLEMGSLLMKSS